MANGSPTHVQPRVRRDVQSLIAEGPSGMKVLEDYATAITRMRELDGDPDVEPADPRSWRFQAALHGFDGVEDDLLHPQNWSSCRHFSWFFLAWHRQYLFYFERMIQFHLQDDTWSLPYWDYTKFDGEDDSCRILPEPFRSPRTDNPLFASRRDADVNHETDPTPLPRARCDARPALAFGTFAQDPAEPIHSFGGGALRDTRGSLSARGALEGTPHGQVHVLVGGDANGLMWDFNTAGLDPIFWLHHCNLDRLWDVWIDKWGVDRLPQHPVFRDTTFKLFDSDGQPVGKPISETVVSSDLGYVYESTAQPSGTPGPHLLDEMAAPEPTPTTPPELLGATTGVDFSRRTSIGVDLAANERVSALAAGDESAGPRWFMRVEDITGAAPKAPSYDVYLNLPDGADVDDHPELLAGSVPAFGIAEASRSGSTHAGTGITDVFDVTDVVSALVSRSDLVFDPAKVTVHIVPSGLKGEVPDGGDVRAGRISIYAG